MRPRRKSTRPAWAKLSAAQQTVLQNAARKAAKAGDDGRLADEASIIEAIKQRGLSVDAIDLAPFRAAADKAYVGDAVKAWDMAWLKRVAGA